MKQYFIGLDLGQAQDYTAIAMLERIGLKPPFLYECSYLERLPLGTPYPAVVEHVKAMFDKEVEASADGEADSDAHPGKKTLLRHCSSLVVDATGVGKPVVDMLREADPQLPRMMAVTITGGNSETHEGWASGVPKRNLVSVLQILLQAERLKVAPTLPLAPTLVQELLNFKVKITEAANDTYGAWREGTHDDLVFAVAFAAWYGERPALEWRIF